MKWAWLILVVVAGCASHTPELRKGAHTAPVGPSYAPVGLGAPTVGQPGARPDLVPRTPYGRILPEDEHTRREPGIWKGAIKEDDDDPAKVITTALALVPLPQDPTGPELFYGLWGLSCTNDMIRILADAKTTDEVARWLDKWSPQARACVFTKVYYNCAAIVVNSNEFVRKMREGRGEQEDFPPNLLRLFAAARAARKKFCDSVILPRKFHDDLARYSYEYAQVIERMGKGK